MAETSRGRQLVFLATKPRYNVAKLLELNLIITARAEDTKPSDDRNLSLVKYNGKYYRAVIFDSGDYVPMELTREKLQDYENVVSHYKGLGVTTQETQTDTANSDATLDEVETSSLVELFPAAINTLLQDDAVGEYSYQEDDYNQVAEQLLGPQYPGSQPSTSYSEVESKLSHFEGFPGECSYGPQKPVTNEEVQSREDHIDRQLDIQGSITTSKILNPPLLSMAEYTDEGDIDDPGLPHNDERQETNRGLVGVDPGEAEEMREQQREEKRKRHFCIFCSARLINLTRHLFSKHQNEVRIIEILNTPPQDPQRQHLLAQLRREGNAKLNEERQKEGKHVVPFKKGVKSTLCPCPNCGAMFSKSTLYRHYKKCAGKHITPRLLTCKAQAKLRSGELPNQMCDELKLEIIPAMHSGPVLMEIISDPDIIFFGNSQCLRYRTDLDRQRNMIRGRLRTVGRLKIEVKKIDPSIKRLRDVFQTSKWDAFIKGVTILANLDEEGKKASPNNINSIGLLLSNIAMDLKVTTPRDEVGENIRKEIESWVELYRRMYSSTIGRAAVQVAEKMKFENRKYAPIASDIIKLTSHLKEQIKISVSRLDKSFSYKRWEDLNKYCMLSLLIFNRKRKAEVQYLTLSDYKRKEKVKDNTDIYQSLSKTEQMISKRYFHVIVRGKLARGVPLLIDETLAKSIDKIVELREEAGVSPSNPYLFAKKEKGQFNVSLTLLDTKFEINLEAPELISSRRLRGHVACVAQALDLTEADIRSLSSFLGHNTQTHLEHYRMPSDAINTARISRLLVALDEGQISKYKGKRIEDIDVDVPLSEIVEADDPQPVQGKESRRTETSPKRRRPQKSHTTPTKKTAQLQKTPPKLRSSGSLYVSPSPKKQRVRWTSPEKTAMRRAFAHHLNSGTLPSFTECNEVRKEVPILMPRKPRILKAWVNNEKRKVERNKKRHSESDDE